MKRLVSFVIIGGGWRSEFFMRIAQALPERFEICGMLVRDEGKGKQIENRWGIRTYRDLDTLLKNTDPAFAVVSVPRKAAPAYIRELAERKIPVLTETPPAENLEELLSLQDLIDRGARIQVAEQYHLQPLHAARLSLAASGLLGNVNSVNISVCHWYHAISLMRRLMGIQYENCEIQAKTFISTIAEGQGRNGELPEERIVDSEQVIATLDFGGKLGIYDFTYDQYFSWIRSLRLQVRGERGEINDTNVKYLLDASTPVEIDLKRLNAGENGNLEGYYLKGILFGDEYAYRNPYAPGRLTDDEIAIAACLDAMYRYSDGGDDFYSLAEASQDHYLALMVDQAARTGKTLITATQPWSTYPLK